MSSMLLSILTLLTQQIYISCIQLEIVGNGTLQLPEGVPFPGAYQYTDPGIVFNVSTNNAANASTIMLFRHLADLPLRDCSIYDSRSSRLDCGGTVAHRDVVR